MKTNIAEILLAHFVKNAVLDKGSNACRFIIYLHFAYSSTYLGIIIAGS